MFAYKSDSLKVIDYIIFGYDLREDVSDVSWTHCRLANYMHIIKIKNIVIYSIMYLTNKQPVGYKNGKKILNTFCSCCIK